MPEPKESQMSRFLKEPNFPLKKKIKNSKDMQIRDNIDALNLDIPYKRDDFFIIGNQSSFSFSLLPYKLRPVPSRFYKSTPNLLKWFNDDYGHDDHKTKKKIQTTAKQLSEYSGISEGEKNTLLRKKKKKIIDFKKKKLFGNNNGEINPNNNNIINNSNENNTCNIEMSKENAKKNSSNKQDVKVDDASKTYKDINSGHLHKKLSNIKENSSKVHFINTSELKNASKHNNNKQKDTKNTRPIDKTGENTIMNAKMFQKHGDISSYLSAIEKEKVLKQKQKVKQQEEELLRKYEGNNFAEGSGDGVEVAVEKNNFENSQPSQQLTTQQSDQQSHKNNSQQPIVNPKQTHSNQQQHSTDQHNNYSYQHTRSNKQGPLSTEYQREFVWKTPIVHYQQPTKPLRLLSAVNVDTYITEYVDKYHDYSGCYKHYNGNTNQYNTFQSNVSNNLHKSDNIDGFIDIDSNDMSHSNIGNVCEQNNTSNSNHTSHNGEAKEEDEEYNRKIRRKNIYNQLKRYKNTQKHTKDERNKYKSEYKQKYLHPGSYHYLDGIWSVDRHDRDNQRNDKINDNTNFNSNNHIHDNDDDDGGGGGELKIEDLENTIEAYKDVSKNIYPNINDQSNLRNEYSNNQSNLGQDSTAIINTYCDEITNNNDEGINRNVKFIDDNVPCTSDASNEVEASIYNKYNQNTNNSNKINNKNNNKMNRIYNTYNNKINNSNKDNTFNNDGDRNNNNNNDDGIEAWMKQVAELRRRAAELKELSSRGMFCRHHLAQLHCHQGGCWEEEDDYDDRRKFGDDNDHVKKSKTYDGFKENEKVDYRLYKKKALRGNNINGRTFNDGQLNHERSDSKIQINDENLIDKINHSALLQRPAGIESLGHGAGLNDALGLYGGLRLDDGVDMDLSGGSVGLDEKGGCGNGDWSGCCVSDEKASNLYGLQSKINTEKDSTTEDNNWVGSNDNKSWRNDENEFSGNIYSNDDDEVENFSKNHYKDYSYGNKGGYYSRNEFDSAAPMDAFGIA